MSISLLFFGGLKPALVEKDTVDIKFNTVVLLLVSPLTPLNTCVTIF
jgi:hypothetical protein